MIDNDCKVLPASEALLAKNFANSLVVILFCFNIVKKVSSLILPVKIKSAICSFNLMFGFIATLPSVKSYKAVFSTLSVTDFFNDGLLISLGTSTPSNVLGFGPIFSSNSFA